MSFPKFLRIAIVPHRHMLEVSTDDQNRTTLARGVEADFIKILSETLHFKYELHVPEKDGWSAMFDVVHLNQSDIGIGHAMITERRMKKVDFIPYLVQSNTFATKLPDYLSKTGAFLKPFELDTWVLFFAISFLGPLLIHSLMSEKVGLARLYLNLIGCYFNQSQNVVGKKNRDRILIGSWAIYSFIISVSYSAFLLSSLTFPSRQRGISTIEELSEAVVEGRYSCYSIRGTAGTRQMIDAEEEYLNVIGKNIVQKTWKSEEDNSLGLPEEIEDDVAILGARFFFLLEYGEPPHTKARVFEESITTWNVGMALNKAFCCKKRLHTVVSRLLSSGIYQKLYDKVVFENRRKKKLMEKPTSDSYTLTLNDLSGVFLLWGVGMGLAFIAFVYENIRYYYIIGPSNSSGRRRKSRNKIEHERKGKSMLKRI